MKRQLFFILTTFLCSIILFPITIAQIDESGNPNISFSYKDDGDKSHCPEFTSSESISVTYPNTIGLCVEVLYSPSEPTQTTVEIMLEEGNSSRLLYSKFNIS